MRLLDHIARSTAFRLIRRADGALQRVSSPCDFAQQIVGCSLRYMLTARLVRMCIELACARGDELSGCLDLVQFPASRPIWIEWDDLLWHPDSATAAFARTATRALIRGALVSAGADQRSATVRTFLLPHGTSPTPVVVPITTFLKLPGDGDPGPPVNLLDRATVAARETANPQVKRLLDCARFRADPGCADLHRSLSHKPGMVTESDFASVAFDVPILLALFLLLTVRADLPQRSVHTRARPQKGRFLGHIELSAPFFPAALGFADRALLECANSGFDDMPADIQRRKGVVFWRRHSWRGHVRLGQASTICIPSESAAPSHELQRSTLTLVCAFCDRILNAGEAGAATELLAEDFAFRGALGPDMRGRKVFCDYVRSLRAALDGSRWEVLDCVTEGTKAFAKVRFSGRHVGRFGGFPPTGKSVHWLGAALFHIHASVIAEMWVVGDFISRGTLLESSAPPQPLLSRAYQRV